MASVTPRSNYKKLLRYPINRPASPPFDSLFFIRHFALPLPHPFPIRLLIPLFYLLPCGCYFRQPARNLVAIPLVSNLHWTFNTLRHNIRNTYQHTQMHTKCFNYGIHFKPHFHRSAQKLKIHFGKAFYKWKYFCFFVSSDLFFLLLTTFHSNYFV